MSILDKLVIKNRAKVVKKDNLVAQKEHKLILKQAQIIKSELQKLYIKTGDTKFVLNRCECDIRFNWEYGLCVLRDCGDIDLQYDMTQYYIDFSNELTPSKKGDDVNVNND